MGSLAHCLKKHNVSPELGREIRDRAAELRAEGYEAQQASVQAVKDRLDTLRSQRDSVLAQVGEKQPPKKSDVRVAEHRGQENTPEFKLWFENSKVVDAAGNPLRLYHGTVHDFSSFEPHRGFLGSYWGAGIYMTDTVGDANENYATQEGPDLRNKIVARVEELINERNFTENGSPIHRWGTPEYKAMYDAIQQEVIASMAPTKGLVLPLYARMTNPMVFGGQDETVLTVDMEETGDDGEPFTYVGTLPDFIEAVEDVAERWDLNPDRAVARLWNLAYEGNAATATEVMDILEADRNLSEAFDDDTGMYIHREVLRQIIERAGFDGIIDRKVFRRFGMKGMKPNTSHYIAFRPIQVKSYTGNSGAFSRSDVRVAEHVTGGTKNPRFKKWFKKSVVVNKDGTPRVMYHGTKVTVDFDAFSTYSREMGSHFGTQDQADKFVAGSYAMNDTALTRTYWQRVMPVYLSIQNPIRLIDKGTFNAREVAIQLYDLGVIDDSEFTQLEEAAGINLDDADDLPMYDARLQVGVQTMLRDKGYDGIVYLNRREGIDLEDDVETWEMDEWTDEHFKEVYPKAEDSYIVFQPGQVKSAASNTGAYDRNNPRISEHRGQWQTPEFVEWFNDSAAVNDDGTPMRLYHGTTKDFDAFKASKDGSLGAGIYLTPNTDQAAQYADGDNARIMPVYASIRRPLRIAGPATEDPVVLGLVQLGMTQAAASKLAERAYENKGYISTELKSRAQKAGYDGIMQWRDGRLMEVVVWEQSQVKSATGNSGTFSPFDGRISEHRQPNAASWHAPAITSPKWENLVFQLQDKHIDTKKIVAAINESRGAPVPEQQDVYLQEELYHGRAAKMSEDFLNRELKPLLEDMAQRKVGLKEFEDYLHNRHAEERNIQIAKVNPKMPDAGSGIKTADARNYLARLPADKRAAYVALARRVDAITARTNQLLVSETLEDQDTINNWNRAYKNYVPLHREDMDSGTIGGTGQGYTVKGPATKRATGSLLPVENILANIAIARERTITRGAKNRVSTALVNLALANRNPDFWDVDAPETIKFIGPAGIVVESIDPLWKNRPNVVVARMLNSAGKVVEHGVVFNKRNERAMRMAEALKNLSTPELSAALGLIAKATRYFSAINTQYNPIFGVVNLTRDAQQLMFNLTTTPIAGKQLAVARRIIPALIGVMRDLRASRKGHPARSSWATTYEEFEKNGGQTGYRDLFVTPQDRTEALMRELKHMDGGAKEAPRAFVRWIGGWLSDYNTAMENATRLAAYKVARDNGVSMAKSASIAKNLTVNFNRKGNVSSQVGALWAFFNASAQGTARLVETRKGPKGKQIIAGGVLAGVLQAFALAAGGFDDDDPPEFVRQRSFIVPLGDKRYFTIPMPLGLNLLPNLGRTAAELVIHGGRGASDKLLSLATQIFDTFSPIGGGASIAQIASPTLFDPAVALLENKDWTGKPIERPDMNPLNPSPGHERAKEKATPWARWLSEGINALSGGTEYQPGRLSPTPDAIDYVLGQVTGGVGREVSKLAATMSALSTGEDLPPHKIPLVGRFYGRSEGQTKEGEAFYKNVIEINKHEREIKGRRENGQDVDAYMDKHPTSELVKQGAQAEKAVSKLRKQRRELVASGAPASEVRAIEQEITDAMKEFNDLVKEVRAGG